jgi:hypothetical protein
MKYLIDLNKYLANHSADLHKYPRVEILLCNYKAELQRVDISIFYAGAKKACETTESIFSIY